MNVTTSANWTRPAVGIVRVEKALSVELGKALGPNRFKQCVWSDGEFIEWLPPITYTDVRHEKAVDIIFPNSKSFDLPRRFFARALSAFERTPTTKSASSSDLLEMSVPLHADVYTQPVYGDIIISVGLDWDQPYTAAFFELSKRKGVKVITCC